MNSKKIVSLFLVVLSASASSFASGKPVSKDKDKQPSEHHRGWIGGQYRLARRDWNWFDTTDAVNAFPKALTNGQKGVLITAWPLTRPLTLQAFARPI